jgi:uncharacterized protein YfaS (alpha-2-macroglobulin family)
MGSLKKSVFTFALIILFISPFFGQEYEYGYGGARSFYLSTDRTYTAGESVKIRVESSSLSSLQVRVYKIADPVLYFLSQDNIHRPKVTGRKMRYFAPEVLTGFDGYLRSSLRRWARNNIPTERRSKIMETYPDFARKDNEQYYSPQKIVDYIKDKNFKLVREENHEFNSSGGDLNVNYIFLNNLPKATYLVEGVNGQNVAYTVLNIADFGFIVKKTQEDCLIYTLNNTTADPVAGIELSVYNRFNRKLESLVSDGSGLAKFKLTESEVFIVGRSKQDIYAFYDPKYFPGSIRDNNVYVYTERPVYRGGDKVYLKGIYRNYKEGVYSAKGEKAVTVKIIDSRGNQVLAFPVKSDSEGIFNGEFSLPPDAVSGRYVILAEIDGKEYQAQFKVEYFQKPEFKVLVTSKESTCIGGDEVRATVQGSYYFGEPLAKAAVRYSIYRTRFSDTQWMEEREKSFYLSEQEYVYSRLELIESRETKLDSLGKAEIVFKTKHENDPFSYRVEAAVVSETGTVVSGSLQVRVYPSRLRLGISADKFVYLAGENVKVGLKLADLSGNPVSGIIKTTVDSDGKVIKESRVTTNDQGQGVLEFSSRTPGFIKISAESEDQAGNKIQSEKYIWIGEEGASYQYSGGIIQLALDKSRYKPGERAKLLIVSPVPEVKFLLTIEGDTIYELGVKKLKGNTALVDIPIFDKYIPNVFVDVSYIFNNRFYNNSIKLNIPPEERLLNIEIRPEKEVYAPKEKGKMIVKVSDLQKRPVANADLSVAIVDEAIYGISNEIAVDIRKFFYPFRRNNVMTWSSIGFRFYGYAMDVASELAQGFYRDPTGMAAFKGAPAERKEFKDTILWIPSLKTDIKGVAVVEVNFPDNITQWRATVVGITGDTKVGRGTGNVITKLDFFTELSLPSYLDEKDKFTVFNTVYNYTDTELETSLTLSGSNIVIANPKQKVKVNPGSSALVKWDLATQGLREATFTLTAEAGRYKDVITKKVGIVPHSIMKSINVNAKLNKKNNTLSFSVPEKVKQGSQTLDLSVSYGYASVILDALDYLVMYPYGCVEQTTSSFLPNLIAVNALNKIGLKNPIYEEKLNKNIEQGLSKLYGFQHPDGSWGWFSEEKINLFMTSYVLYALTLTRNLGYGVDEKVLARGIAALEKYLGQAANDTEKVYALYVLSLNGKQYANIFDSLKSKAADLNPYSQALLALTAVNYNKTPDALNLVGRLKAQLKKEKVKDLVYWGEDKTTEWYQDNVETTAWVLRALIRVEPRSEYVSRAVEWLFYNKNGKQWKSTRDTAAAVFALSDLLSIQSEKQKYARFALKLNNQRLGEIEYKENNYTTQKQYGALDLAGMLKKDNLLAVEGISSDEPVLVSLAFSYYTDDNIIYADTSGIRVNRTYYELSENKTYSGGVEYRKGEILTEFKTGENVLVEIDFGLRSREDYVLVEDYFPAGCTPVKDFKLHTIRGYSKADQADFIDYRDEKVVFFYNTAASHKIYYVLRPVFTGSFEVMPAIGSLMYFPAFRGNSNDNHVSIK